MRVGIPLPVPKQSAQSGNLDCLSPPLPAELTRCGDFYRPVPDGVAIIFAMLHARVSYTQNAPGNINLSEHRIITPEGGYRHRSAVLIDTAINRSLYF